MLATFYPAAPNETAFSLLAAAALGTPEHSVHHALSLAFRRCAPLIYTLPCRINKFCEMTNSAYGSLSSILERHTLFNFFISGMSAPFQERLQQQLIGGTKSRTCAPHLPVFLECGNRYGLDCPECTQEHLQTVNRRASLCRHCLPFVSRCFIHRCSLIVVDACSKFESLCVTNCGSPAAATNSLEYAKFAFELSVDSNASGIRNELKSLLTARGYVAQSGRFNLSDLKHDFSAFFSDGFEDARLTHLLAKTCIPETAVRILVRDERAIHPVYVVLLKWFLQSSQGMRRSAVSSAVQCEKNQNLEPSDIKRTATNGEQIEKKRKAWLYHLTKCAGLTRTQTRLRDPSLWTWLYRHDRLWLDQHQAPKRQIARQKKAATLPPFLGSLFSHHREIEESQPNRPPPLDSAYQARLWFGLSDYQLERLCSSIAGIGSFAQRPAAKQSFVSKRIDWALQHLSQKGMPINEFTVARASRLRLATIRQHLNESGTKSLFIKLLKNIHE